MSVSVPFTEESVRAALQARLAAECREFAECVVLACPHDPRHGPAALVYDLDDCPESDEDPGTNVPYGGMHAVMHLATALGLEVETRFPDLEPSMER